MKKTVVLVSKYNDYLESVKYSFKNVIELDGEVSVEDRDKLINEVEKYDSVILVDYLFVYRYLLQNIEKNYKWIITFDISCLSMIENRIAYKALMEFYDRRFVSEIVCIDEGFYNLLKNAGYKVKKLKLDINQKFKVKKNNNIGIVGNDWNPLDNYYNELTCIKLVNCDNVILSGKTNATKEFINFFNLNCINKANDLEVIKSCNIILECSFANLNLEKILIALDNGVIPIVGNTTLFDKYKVLKKYLVLESDDDVNEIVNKINIAKNNRKEIFEEYKKYRFKYREECKKSIKDLLI